MSGKVLQLRRLGLLAAVLAVGTSSLPAQASGPKPVGSSLRNDMRKVWEDHITWTRMYIVSAAANLPEKDVTAQRLMKNQEDIGAAITPFYGDAAGQKLTGLLKEHITIATEIIDAAMKGDTSKKEKASTRWTANADEIAAFLSSANPSNWPLAEMKQMLHSHLELTAQEVVAHLSRDWTGSVTAYDKIHEQILHMADALSTGIINQFPQKAM